MEQIYIDRDYAIGYTIMAIHTLYKSANEQFTIKELMEEIKVMFAVYKEQDALMDATKRVLQEEWDIKLNINAKEYITLKECAEHLGISKQLMSELVREKDFPCVRFKRRMLINRRKIRDWFDNNAGKRVKY